MTDAVVIGAGVIGLSCAYSLRRRGLDVTVVEREASGVGASWGNTGWVTSGLSTPLPAPGVRTASLGWLVRRSGPLAIRPWKDKDLPSWLWQFWHRCNRRDYASGLSVLATLNERTGELFDALEADGVPMGLERHGILLAYRTSRRLEHARRDVEATVKDTADTVYLLDRDAVREAEPALRDVAGGVLVESDGYLRPEVLGAGLTARMRTLGVRIVHAEEVVGVERRGCRVTHVVGSTASWPSDVVVLAAGAWSGGLARRMGFALPIQPGKGYSITVARPQLALRRPVYLAEAKIALSPFHDVLRASGTMELVGFDTGIDIRRVTQMGAALRSFVPSWEDAGASHVWAGLRPLTPDGLPAVGRAPGLENVFVAAGHAMLGMTLAPATGELLAALIVDGTLPDPLLGRLDPIRFN